MPRLAVVHTVTGLAPVFDALLREHLLEVDRYHIVDESLLFDARG